jgi:release factor glutamine methyltransferase
MEWSEPAADRTCEQFFDMIARRAKHEPLQYIVGIQGFLNLAIKVQPGVLIPRLDTEIVANTACEVYKQKKGDTVLEIGCGSGAIAITMAKEVRAKVTAVDINPLACELTKENASHNGVKVDVLCGDMFGPVKKKKYHMIISNPPYIRSDEIAGLMPEVRDFEPRSALDGTADGLFFYEILAQKCGGFLKENGAVYFEIGHDQGEAVKHLLDANGFIDTKVVKDLAGNDRVVCGRWQTA